MCREFGVSGRMFLGGVARAHLPPIAATLAVGWLIRLEEITNVVELAAAALALIATYLLTFAATGVRAYERRRLFSAGRGRAAKAFSRIF
jgi:hypothetical protein